MPADTDQTVLFADLAQQIPALVQVIGVGDAGCRAASEIWRRRMNGVEVTCVDTDALSLDRSQCDRSILLGAATMHGFGSGGDDRAVVAAASEQSDAVRNIVTGARCVIVVAGLSGSTGSSAAPVIASAVKSSGALVTGVAITPLELEPLSAHIAAASSLDRLRISCDAVLEVPRFANPDRSNAKAGLRELFSADRRYVAAFVSTVSTIAGSGPGRCEASPGDLRAVLRNGERAMFGSGTGFGHTGASDAARTCLDTAIAASDGAHEISRALVLIESGPDISVSHIAAITSLIEDWTGTEADLHTVVHRSRLFGDNIRVSIVGCSRQFRRPLITGPVSAHRGSDFEASALPDYRATALSN